MLYGKDKSIYPYRILIYPKDKSSGGGVCIGEKAFYARLMAGDKMPCAGIRRIRNRERDFPQVRFFPTS